MSYEARALANATLDIADQLGMPLTHMAVHKVIFHAHGWHLAGSGNPLVASLFEAWEFGPVLPTVYQAFKQCGKEPIMARAMRFDPATQNSVAAKTALNPLDKKLLHDILRSYGHIHAFQLSRVTHREGGAWDRTWNAPKGVINLGMRINNEAIRSEFLTLEDVFHHNTGLGDPRLAN